MRVIATALAHPNIAVVKYWGKRDRAKNLPAVPSLSLTLDQFVTRTRVELGVSADSLHFAGVPSGDNELRKVSRFLDICLGVDRPPARVDTENNFPTAAGLASSSSAFAALALAACAAGGKNSNPAELSRLARQGSGSACRSIWGGWVAWPLGEAADGSDCHGIPLAAPGFWDLRLVVAVVASGPKAIGSTEGMVRTQETCPLYPGFVSSAPADFEAGKAAILARDLQALGEVMERSTRKMHATMIATDPGIRYWRPGTLSALEAVEGLRKQGVSAWATQDAGPNVKVLCTPEEAPRVVAALEPLVERVINLGVGGDARLV